MCKGSSVHNFLKQVQEANKIIIVPTDKNRRTRYALGITVEDQEAIIKNLRADDYVKGPVNDYDKNRKEKLWVFKHSHFGDVLYIKLKLIVIVENRKNVKCLSCHIDGME